MSKTVLILIGWWIGFCLLLTFANDDLDLNIVDTQQTEESCHSPQTRINKENLKDDKNQNAQTHKNNKSDKINKKTYEDVSYQSIEEIPKDKRPKHMFGCGVVYIPPGSFWMGSEDEERYDEDGESPIRRVKISKGFWMDSCEVTNGAFLEFWNKSNYKNKTEAEKYQWSFVFELLVSPEINQQIETAVQGATWWIPVPSADFRHPEGPDSNFNDRLDHPVIHVGWTDANAYCKWRKGRLPTEAEWEYAARGGLEKKKFPWGDVMHPNLTIDGTYSMNVFTGEPYKSDNGADKYKSTAPVGSYWPNGYGLYDMTGNVWEWILDFYTNRPSVPPKGKRLVDPKGPANGRDRVMKGGSYMCHQKTCRRYRVAGRSHAEADSSTGNLGLRCIYDKEPTPIDASL